MDPNETKMITINQEPAPGWKGGFVDTSDKFPYPKPDLSELPMLGNMDNIQLLDRQQKVIWPEFSWRHKKKLEKTRAFTMFAPDISRLGYTNEGRVYSIICPQQGVTSKKLGTLNVEITVTGQRGWVDEDNKELAADMSVEATIWFSPSAMQKPWVSRLYNLMKGTNLFPMSKEKAIKVDTHRVGHPEDPIFDLRKGMSDQYEVPEEHQHHDKAWGVGNLDVEIGPVRETNNMIANGFNRLVIRLFNLYAGNMLQRGNTLSWNVWFTAPQTVDKVEWSDHAKKWRDAIQADHAVNYQLALDTAKNLPLATASPSSLNSFIKLADGSVYNPIHKLLDGSSNHNLAYDTLQKNNFSIKGMEEEEDLLVEYERQEVNAFLREYFSDANIEYF